MARELKKSDGGVKVAYNRSDFCSYWWKSRHEEYSAPVVRRFVNDFFDVLKDFLQQLDDGDTLRLVGLGTFEIVRREASQANFGEGKVYNFPARNVLKFTLDGGLKRAIRKDVEGDADEDIDDEFDEDSEAF